MKVEGYAQATYLRYRRLVKDSEHIRHKINDLRALEPRITATYGSGWGGTDTEQIVIARVDSEAELLKAMKRINAELAIFEQALSTLKAKMQYRLKHSHKVTQGDKKALFIAYRRAYFVESYNRSNLDIQAFGRGGIYGNQTAETENTARHPANVSGGH